MYVLQNRSDVTTYTNDEAIISFTLNAFHYTPKINIDDLEFIDGDNFYLHPFYNGYRNSSSAIATKAGKLHVLISSLLMLYDNIRDRLYKNIKSKISHLNEMMIDTSEYNDKCIEYYYLQIKKVFKDYTGLNLVLTQNFFEDSDVYCKTSLMASIIKFSNTYYGFYECIKDIIFSDNIHICLDMCEDTNVISNGYILNHMDTHHDLFTIRDGSTKNLIEYNGSYLNVYNNLHHIDMKISTEELNDFDMHEFNTYISIIGVNGILNCYEAWVKLKERNIKLYGSKEIN